MLSWIFTSMLIILKGEELCPGHEHCINPHHSTGLIDLTTLGNLLELIHLLDGHHYSQKISEPEQAEMQHTRQEFAEFKTLFCQNHHLVFNFCTQADPKVSFFWPFLPSLCIIPGPVQVYHEGIWWYFSAKPTQICCCKSHQSRSQPSFGWIPWSMQGRKP